MLDENDNQPSFEKESYIFEIIENSPIGIVVGKVRAIDLDQGQNSMLKYSIVQSNNYFLVDHESGMY